MSMKEKLVEALLKNTGIFLNEKSIKLSENKNDAFYINDNNYCYILTKCLNIDQIINLKPKNYVTIRSLFIDLAYIGYFEENKQIEYESDLFYKDITSHGIFVDKKTLYTSCYYKNSGYDVFMLINDELQIITLDNFISNIPLTNVDSIQEFLYKELINYE